TGTDPAPDALWGNGELISTVTGTTPADGNPYNNGSGIQYYQKPNKTAYDPCPAGWRVPTQDEWETLANYCNPSSVSATPEPDVSGSFSTSTSDSRSAVTPVGSGTATIPTNNPNLVWVTVVKGLPDNSVAGWGGNNAPSSSVPGYAIYNKVDWLGADGSGGAKAYLEASGSNRLYDDACPSPLLFLSATGCREQSMGKEDSLYTGQYWSSTVNESSNYAHRIFLENTRVLLSRRLRVAGQAVRCVAE
ncbi:MAG: fibrobacter succinogenes major paralogous domain-containing protein, partial [Prevotellaceae bacterium]|nr:fibrobacter succinogenes major paralogous domain-containing protein [Prevotellaceae bacterium]